LEEAPRGFTLVELLVVLTLLSVVIAVSLPTLGAFFRGRSLDAEARRLLALTHLAQSRAAGEGIPMTVWLDSAGRTYGLEADPGWDTTIDSEPRYELSTDVELEVVRTNVVRQANAVESAGSRTVQLTTSARQHLPGMRFMPDGSLAPESVAKVVLKDRGGATVQLRQSAYRRGYELMSPDENIRKP
jgi:general secretion pathway protein H